MTVRSIAVCCVVLRHGVSGLAVLRFPLRLAMRWRIFLEPGYEAHKGSYLDAIGILLFLPSHANQRGEGRNAPNDGAGGNWRAGG